MPRTRKLGKPRESWLKSDDPEKWAAACCVCTGSHICGQDGYCIKGGECFRNPPRLQEDEDEDTLLAKIEALTKRVAELEERTQVQRS